MTDAPQHDELEQLVVDHVLGRLDPDDDARALEHLDTCATCRAVADDVAATAAALRRLAPDPATSEAGERTVAPLSLDDRMEALFAAGLPEETAPVADVVALRPPRRRLIAVAAAAAVVGLLAGSGVTALVTRDDAPVAAPAPAPAPGPVVLPVATLETEAGVTATAGVVDHTWGVELKLTTEGLPAGRTYRVVVTGDDGRRYHAGAFVGVSGRPVVCNMNSGVLLARAASFAVLDDDRPVVWGDLPAPRA